MDGSAQSLDINGGGPIDIHQPFTPGERIQQLSETDQDIASLLVHLSSAMRALATPPGGTVSQTVTTNSIKNSTTSDVQILESTETAAAEGDPVLAFNAAQASFFNTLDRVDKHLTRQILALEEAGIITLRNTAAGAGATGSAAEGGPPGGEAAGAGPSSQQQQQQPEGGAGDASKARAAGPRRLEPDGMGRYGNLDVGKLNMASSTVERDMERELWRRAREELTKVVGDAGDGGGDRMEL
ncbi:mediator complex, subunit Med11 [Corynascus similis CBS 632.67]